MGVHGLGVVAKIDMAEIRAPFIEAAFLALGVGLLFIGLGTVAVRAVGPGYERELEEANANLELATRELAAREARYAAIARNLPRGAVTSSTPTCATSSPRGTSSGARRSW